MPANFRSYEGQLRLLTAVIAAHPDLRLNYKATAAHYGSDWSASGIEHFFRPIKKNSTAIQAMVKQGQDAADFAHNSIHKYFGDSTPDGLQFQFRAIKQEANNMRQGKGGAALPGPAAGPSTPAGRTPKTPRTASLTTGRKRAAGPVSSAAKTPTAPKRARGRAAAAAATKVEASDDDDDDDDDDVYVPAPVLTPNVDEEAMRAHEAKMAAAETAPSLASAQAASPSIEDDDDDIRVITPADAAPSFPYSHSPSAPHTPAAAAAAAAAAGFPFDKFDAPARFDAGAFFDGASRGGRNAYVEDDDADDGEYDV